jgi:hypothetical protein
MMDPVADNEHPREQPPADLVPGDSSAAPPPAHRPPTEITQEQIRQFQEFQRFQELMREQGLPPGTPPPSGGLPPWGPPPPKQSLPKRLLKATVSKIVTGLVILAVLVVAGYLAVDYFFGENDLADHPQAHDTGGGKATTNLIYETSPRNAVLKVYDDIAQGDAKSACSRFTDAARDQFTKNMSEYGSTCAEIVTTINRSVAAQHMKSDYANPWIPGSAVPTSGDTVSVSSCAIEVTGGPRLGLLTLSKIPNSQHASGEAQWIVSAHQAEPTNCGGTSSTTPTS